MIDWGQKFKEFVESKGYVLLGPYKGQRIKTTVVCSNGHEYLVSPNKFKRGRRCPLCPTSKQTFSKNRFERLLLEFGYQLLEGCYKNAHSKIKLVCPDGHLWETTPNSFKRGHRCGWCSSTSPGKAKQNFIQILKDEQYVLKTEYDTALSKVEVMCPDGHYWLVRPNDFISSGVRCPHCAGSSGQRRLQHALKQKINTPVIYNDRKTLNGLELDIYFSSIKTAIEYQGNYWHSLPNVAKNDLKKHRLCKEMGINLLEVWDNDFLLSPEKEISIVVSLIQQKIMESNQCL